MKQDYLTPGIWVIATVAAGYALHEGGGILAPFALAVFVWLVMEGTARTILRRAPMVPTWLAHTVAIAGVAGAAVLFIAVMRNGAKEFAAKSDVYEQRINALIASAYHMVGIEQAPTLAKLIYSGTAVRFIEPVLNSVQGLAADITLILIYVGFLYLASTQWTEKLDRIFPSRDTREHARIVLNDIRRTMEQYLWVQTLVSIVNTALTYVTMLALGLDNALFWAFVIFFLNYIPTVGSLIAAALPALFALAQTDWPAWMPSDPTWSALFVLLGVSFWQFFIGNFVQPKMMGEELNLSGIVVLLSLAVWGALWGLPGMFLSAPLTVLLMILLAQVPGARWIAILLSADGDPTVRSKTAGGHHAPSTPQPAKTAE